MFTSKITSGIVSAVNELLTHQDENDPVKQALRRSIHEIRNKRLEASKRHALKMSRRQAHLQSLQQQITTLLEKDHPLHVYAGELKDCTHPIPTHVIVLQAQVCRAIHLLCIYKTQLQLLQRTHTTLLVITKNQQGLLLNKVLWAVEMKVQLQQQQQHEHHHSRTDDCNSIVANESNTSNESEHEYDVERITPSQNKETRNDVKTTSRNAKCESDIDSLVEALASLKQQESVDTIEDQASNVYVGSTMEMDKIEADEEKQTCVVTGLQVPSSRIDSRLRVETSKLAVDCCQNDIRFETKDVQQPMKLNSVEMLISGLDTVGNECMSSLTGQVGIIKNHAKGQNKFS